MMYQVTFLALVVAAGAPAAAQAPPAAAPDANQRSAVVKTLDQNFGKADINNDGFLSDEEVRATAARALQQIQARMEQEFNNLDKDKNGALSLEEFRAAANARMAQFSAGAMQQLDTNRDGKVSPAEFKAGPLATFDRIDANKNGTLSPEEKQKAQGR